MSKQPHTEFRLGQRVLVLYRDGTRTVGKYAGKTSKGIRINNLAAYRLFIPTKLIRQVVIYKPAERDGDA